jgi:predicted negative regulator of RcsB-dependent stress response
MDSFGKLIVLVVIPFLVGFYGVRYYNTTQEPQVQQDSKGVQTSIETGRIKCVDPKAGYCEEYIILKVVKD